MRGTRPLPIGSKQALPRSRKLALTLPEILVVVLIIVILYSLLLPVLSSVKLAARATSTKSKLRQLYVALELYRHEYDGNVSGNLASLGLPTTVDQLGIWEGGLGGVRLDTWRSACAPHPQTDPPKYLMYYLPVLATSEEELVRFSSEYGPSLPLIGDDQCTLPSVHIRNPYQRKRGLAVLLDGSLIDKQDIGDTLELEWWLPRHRR